jgi:hypothetical protein
MLRSGLAKLGAQARLLAATTTQVSLYCYDDTINAITLINHSLTHFIFDEQQYW